MQRRAYLDLFLIAFLILFFELAAIRWFAATVVFLTFFTNLVLLACFLGMSVGLLSARSGRNFVPAALPMSVLAFGAAIALHLAYWKWADGFTVMLGAQQAAPQLIYFGTEYRPADPSRWLIPMWAIAATFFALIALSFVGLGQVMGRAFSAIPNRVVAYSVDVLGSLTGIAVFAAMSYLELSPTVWFIPVVALMLYFAGWNRPAQLAAAAALVAFAFTGAHALLVHGPLFWSPYYKVAYDHGRRAISTNDIGHQEMKQVGKEAPAYLVPHLLNRDAGGRPFEEILIIGAGSGNDVAAALRSGAKRVDAVEIDPLIQDIGRHVHPDKPYADKRVTAHLDDGRSFVRKTPHKYDLAVYALVDSLVLHSGYSSLRLENFLYTREAIAEVKRTLKPDGVFLMYNYYRQGWVTGRLARIAEEVFGEKPIVISVPHQARISAGDSAPGHFTFLLASSDSSRLRAMRERFQRGEAFWIHPEPARSEAVNAFRPSPPGADWHRVAPAQVDLAGIDEVPTDDWPQLYLRGREIPWSPIGQGMLAVALISLVILFAFAPARGAPNWQMFFLGAGFMLLETKGVVHMALLFGGTWIVNSIVFFAILVMVLCANLYVLKFRPQRLLPYYILLVAGLLVNALVPMSAFLSLDPAMRIVASCLVVFLPVLFAGVVFASSFQHSRQPDVDFGWNVAGIILGGLSEHLSLVLGFNHLLFVAVAFYLLSLALRRRSAELVG